MYYLQYNAIDKLSKNAKRPGCLEEMYPYLYRVAFKNGAILCILEMDYKKSNMGTDRGKGAAR
jgi:hypothetical protein